MEALYTIEDLKYLMARLRDPEKGCPWDCRQDFASIVPHTLEEAYEVADAIERKDFPHLSDELGDLLFQVIFYAQLADEGGAETGFDFDLVVDRLVRKLIRRHPHVFPKGTLESELPDGVRISEEEIKTNWERIKAEERALSDEAGKDQDKGRLSGIARSLPAMARAEKLQRRAAHYGFDWPDPAPVFDKIEEELGELREAWAQAAIGGDRDALEDELGDLLFATVNLARFLKVNPEQALRRTNRKFERRFGSMERQLAARGEVMETLSLTALDRLWDAAKKEEKARPGTYNP